MLVTGSSRGIGFDIARMFLEAGARVAINGSSYASVDNAMTRLENFEEKISAPGNIGTVDGCESTVQAAIDAFSGLDILVNNAGVGAGRPIAECDEAMWDAHCDVNLKGLFFCCRAAIPALTESNGNIVNIASTAAVSPRAGLTWYNGTKGAVVTLTKSMAMELAPEKEEALRHFDTGMVAYKQHEWASAREHFQDAVRACPDDGPSILYVSRCDEHIADPPPADWDFVVRRTEK